MGIVRSVPWPNSRKSSPRRRRGICRAVTPGPGGVARVWPTLGRASTPPGADGPDGQRDGDHDHRRVAVVARPGEQDDRSGAEEEQQRAAPARPEMALQAAPQAEAPAGGVSGPRAPSANSGQRPGTPLRS